MHEYEDDYSHPEPSLSKIAEDKAKLAEFLSEAQAIQELTLGRRRALGIALQEYARTHLRPYCYNYAGVEGLIVDIVQTADLDAWELQTDQYQFWLPSNFGC